MFPLLFEYGPITIFSLWFCVALGFFVSGYIFIKLAIWKRYKVHFLMQNFFSLMISGLIVSRIIFVLRHSSLYFYESWRNGILSSFAFWDKGLSFWGFILGFSIMLLIKTQKAHENTGKWFDLFVIASLIGATFGNIGTFLDGTYYGKETSLPWGVIFESPYIQFTTPIHPTQVYAALYCLLLSIGAIVFFIKKRRPEGLIAISGMMGYGVLRGMEEFLRGDEVLMIFGIREGHILAISMILFSGILLFIRYNNPKDLTPLPHE